MSARSIRTFMVVAGLVFCIPAMLSARQSFGYDPDAERRFVVALKHFEEGRFSDAREEFRLLATPARVHQKTTASYLMAAKSCLMLEEYTAALSLLNDFFSRFPASSYREDALYSLGIGYVMTRQYRSAARGFADIIDRGENDSLIRLAEPLLYAVAIDRLSSASVRGLIDEVRSIHAKDFLTIALAEKYSRDGNEARSSILLRQIIEREPPSLYRVKASETLARASTITEIRVGVMLPLMRSFPSSPSRPLAEEILDGITFALEESRGTGVPARSISLDVRDTDRDTNVVRRTVQDFSSDERVVAAIGPMYSAEASVAARASKSGTLPIITPTANARGIAAPGSSMFQLNPDLSLHGRALARYAVRELHLRTFAVIAPDDPNIRTQVEGFLSELKALGGDVVANLLYADAAEDLKDAFMILRGVTPGKPMISFATGLSKREREKLLSAGIDARLLDSLVRTGGSVPLTQLLGPDGRNIADSLDIDYKRPPTHDEDFVTPMTSVDAIFTPVTDPDDIGAIASQASYFNIEARLLGNAEWYDLSHLEPHRRYLKKPIFCSDSYTDEHDPEFREFQSQFQQSRKKMPTRYSLFGYDAMSLILRAMQESGASREKILRGLASMRGVRSHRTTVSFNGGRVNNVVQLLEYDGNAVIQLGEVELR